MRILGENKVIPDGEVIFYDGFVFIIQRKSYVGNDNLEKTRYIIDVKCLNGEYDEPVSLADIAEQYPNVCKVIYDDVLRGYVYNYGNHRIEENNEAWEQIGTTLGYA